MGGYRIRVAATFRSPWRASRQHRPEACATSDVAQGRSGTGFQPVPTATPRGGQKSCRYVVRDIGCDALVA